jgi:hypothetical protein
MRLSAIVAIALIGFVFVGFSGCTPRTQVALKYQPTLIKQFPCRKSVSIVTFKDDLNRTTIGETQKGEPIHATDSVSEWISRALYDELRRAGCRVEYHDAVYAFDTDVTLTGEIKALKIVQMTYTEYDSDMRLNIILQKQGQREFSKEYYSTFTKKTLPSSGVSEEVLTELLQGMIQEIIPDLRSRLE